MQERSALRGAEDLRPEGSACPAVFERRFPRDPASIGAARRAVDELGAWLQPTLLADLRLLVSELVANSVEHGPRGYGRTIRLEMSISDERVRAEVQDGGCGFTAMSSLPPGDAPSGRGLFFVDQLAACWGVTSGDGSHVWFELDLERFEAADDGLEPHRDALGARSAA